MIKDKDERKQGGLRGLSDEKARLLGATIVSVTALICVTIIIVTAITNGAL